MLLKTPLHDFHVRHGGKMVDFAGWELPIMYKRALPGGGESGGIQDEHKQVRRSGGIFDVSHMGRVNLRGRHAARLLERLCTRRIRDMAQGQCRYSLVCNEAGGVRDDVIVSRLDDDEFLVVVNASNRQKILGHMAQVQQAGGLSLTIDDQTERTAMVAVQGPRVVEFVGKFSREIPGLKRYTFAVKNLLVVKLMVSRTGYTGEDGVEVILPASMVGLALKLILKDTDPSAPDALIAPAGLGARDTLRLEAGMPLYGHELGEETSALEAGLDFAVTLDKEPDDKGQRFIGAEALLRARDAGGPARRLVGLRLEGKRSARQGMRVLVGGAEAGLVTSGAPSPTLGHPIALAYLSRAHSAVGTGVEIDTGSAGAERLRGSVVALPFYKAPKPAPAAPTPAKA